MRLTGLDIDQLEVVANELRIGVQAHLQIERCVSARLDAHIMLPVVPQRIDARTIQLAIPRNPVIDLPLSWRIISNLFVGDLRTVLRQKLESVLRTEPRARLVIPTSPGVRAAFQGASVKGSGNSVVLHVVGDVHVEDSVFTALLVTRWNPLAIDLESIR